MALRLIEMLAEGVRWKDSRPRAETLPIEKFGTDGLVDVVDLLDGPLGSFGEDRVFGCRPGFELREEVRVAGVAHGDGYVALHAFAAGALDGRTLEPALELGSVHVGEPVQGRVDELGAWENVVHSVHQRIVNGRSSIPGADVLADVAAEDLAADGGAEIFRDASLLLDGEVGDAARGVHLVRGDEGVGRAGIDAARAGAAAVGRDLEYDAFSDWNGRDDDAEQQPGAELLVDDAGVLADPADAGAGSSGALDERAGVNVAAGLNFFRVEALLDGGLNDAEAGEELVVVVGGDEVGGIGRVGLAGLATPGVAGDPAGVGRRRVSGKRREGVVVEGAYDDGTGPGDGDLHGAAKEGAMVVAALEVVHLAGAALGDPVGEALCVEVVGCGVDGGDACGVETGVDGLLAQPLFERGSPLVVHDVPLASRINARICGEAAMEGQFGLNHGSFRKDDFRGSAER
jgi:hypothetical protein